MNSAAPRRLFVTAIFGLAGACGAAATAAEQSAPDRAADVTAGDDAIVSLAAYNVKADRIEDFGFRITEPFFTFVGIFPRAEAPYITEVLPNTAAAKAGLQPGDRILKSDGKSAAMTIFTSAKWAKLMRAKNAEAASGKKIVTWTLEIQPRGTRSKAGSAQTGGKLAVQSPKVVTLRLPTPPPGRL
jgi:hypothetical protein